MILIISNKQDITVDFVIRELRLKKHPFLRLNTEDFPKERCSVTISPFSIKVTKLGKEYDLTKGTRVIWNRRPGKPYDNIPKSKKPKEAIVRFVNDQWYSWLESLQLLPEVLWINHPQANDAMESKIRQLLLAKEVGFDIPETLITNDPNLVRSFFRKNQNKMVAKALYSPLIEDENQDYFIFSNRVNSLPIEAEDEIEISPTIYQQELIPKVDYRITVIGNYVYSVKITNKKDKGLSHDWRIEKEDLVFKQVKLPSRLEQLCRNYVKQSGLIFGAIDLIKNNGRYIFLEINPNGEWGWLQKPHGVPIAESLCNLMIEYDKLGKYAHAVSL